MVAYLVVFLQHNLARRHEPTASMARLLAELVPFSFLKRSATYLDSAIATSCFPDLLSSLRAHVGHQGFLPRILPIALIQEPVLNDGHPVGFNNFKVLNGSLNPRSIIVTLQSANITLIPYQSNKDLTLAVLRLNSKSYIVGSFYHDIANSTVNIDSSEWGQLAPGVILAGDSNAHSTVWGSSSNNIRGDAWEEFILANDLEIANDGLEYTFENHIGRSKIDLTLHKNAPIAHWSNTTMQYGSDHSLITFDLSGDFVPIERKLQNIANTDWALFQASLPQLSTEAITSTAQLNTRANQLIRYIKEAFTIACPPKRALPCRPCKWWNKTLSTLLRKKNLAAREARKYSGTVRGTQARSKKVGLGRLFNKYLKKAKSESWQEFVTNLEGYKNVSSILKSIKTKNSFDIPLLMRQDSTWAKNTDENLNILRQSHFSNSTKNYSVNDGDCDHIFDELPDDLDAFLSWEMIKKAIDELPNGKAPGRDGIRNEVIKMLPDVYVKELLTQCRLSILTSFIPTAWLEINTIYIKKSGKPNASCPRTYRPIGLSSCFLKLCERLINWRIKATVLRDHIPKQHAFAINRSTETAISEVVHVLEKAKYNGMIACLLSIDIQGAFDSVPFDSIRDALIAHGTEDLIWKWSDYLSRNRVMFTALGTSIDSYRPLEGTTQGGLNGPDYWAIFLWNIILIRAMRVTNALKFADDLSSIIIGRDLAVIRDLMQSCLNEFNEWFTQRGLKISASKSTCLIVNKPLRQTIPPPLHIGTETVPFVTQVRYLGITIDSKLSWKPHIKDRITKAKKDLMYARKLVGDQWGLSPEKIIWIYEAIVRPTLDYSCHVWASTNAWPIWLERELTKLQRLALLCATKAQKSTPTRAIERLLNILPLHLHLKKKSAITIARISDAVSRANWDGIGRGPGRGHLFKWLSYLEPLKPIKLVHKYNFFPPTVNLESSDPDGTCVYTDGSKIDNRVGLGWAVCNGDRVVSDGYKRLPDHCTVYEAELLAISQAIIDLRSLNAHGKINESSITFFVDNQAALHTIRKIKLTGETRVRVVDEILSFQSDTGISLIFKWIKGHADFTGNELADALAKSGSACDTIIASEPSLAFIKSQIHKRINVEWDMLWSGLTDCRQSKELISFRPSRKEAKYTLKRGPYFCKKIISLLTGHNNLAYHTANRLRASNINFSSSCRFCDYRFETSWHLLYDCPSLDSKRREYMFSPDNPKTGPDIAWYEKLAVKLGIWEIVLTRLDIPEITG